MRRQVELYFASAFCLAIGGVAVWAALFKNVEKLNRQHKMMSPSWPWSDAALWRFLTVNWVMAIIGLSGGTLSLLFAVNSSDGVHWAVAQGSFLDVGIDVTGCTMLAASALMFSVTFLGWPRWFIPKQFRGYPPVRQAFNLDGRKPSRKRKQ
jgi:hypothetical protein